MNPPSNAVPEFPLDPQGAPPAAMSATRPLYWSVRRELWENRSIYLAPLVVAAVVLFGLLIHMIGLPKWMQTLPTLDPARQHTVVVRPFSMAPAPIMLATFLVGIFYSLEALYGERRDRSILFWKSLPVSDLTAVLAKASIPLVVLPLIGFVLSVATVVIMLLVSTAVLLANGMSPAPLWAEVRLFQQPLVMLYGLTVHALWFAPIYGWLLLVSVWARRTPVLWAALPLFAALAVERIAFNTPYLRSLLEYRLTGALTEAFAVTPRHGGEIVDRLSQLDPVRFLSSPGLWSGLIFAAAFLAAAVRLRRYREPI
ncbi:MAG TPA: ABC transporter permease [Thermoanaerobaculia bacterium]|jgi:ABC-2 type transport system permease protein